MPKKVTDEIFEIGVSVSDAGGRMILGKSCYRVARSEHPARFRKSWDESKRALGWHESLLGARKETRRVLGGLPVREDHHARAPGQTTARVQGFGK